MSSKIDNAEIAVKPVIMVPKNTEFETKYRVDAATLIEFKQIADKLPNLKKFIYVEGPDIYYTNEHITKKLETFSETLSEKNKEAFQALFDDTIGAFPPFMRYRRPSHGLDGDRKELTTKYKQSGSKNNIQREEKNIRVDNVDEDTIMKFVSDLGYKLNFSIWKTCQIYNLDDATIVFYQVYDTTNGGKATKVDTFVEIEVDEESISLKTEKEAWAIIEKYEKILEPIGLSAKTRLRKSLFEMYRRDPK
jgi:adenylate cyclase class IV